MACPIPRPKTDKAVFYRLLQELTAEYEHLWTETSDLLRSGLRVDVPPRASSGKTESAMVLPCAVDQVPPAENPPLVSDNPTSDSPPNPPTGSSDEGGVSELLLDEVCREVSGEIRILSTKQEPNDTPEEHAQEARAAYTTHSIREEWAHHVEVLEVKLDSLDHSEAPIPPTLSSRVSQAYFEEVQEPVHEVPPGCCKYIMLYPGGKVRIAWTFASLVLLGYDIVMVPLDVSFSMEESLFTTGMVMLARVFWTLDIFLTFMTGVINDGKLVMNPMRVARLYAKSWLAFDVILVAVEWASLLSATGSGNSLFRIFRWSRMARALRSVRLLKIQKLKPYMRGFMTLDSKGLSSGVIVLRDTVFLSVLAHCIACVWHFLGELLDEGWVKSSDLQDASTTERYAVAFHWLLLHTQAGTHEIRLSTAAELLMDALVHLVIFCLMAYYIASVVNLVRTWASSDISNLFQIKRSFVRRYQLDYEVSYRLDESLSAHHLEGVADVIAQEKLLFDRLPARLQMDLHYEIRAKLTETLIFFSHMESRTPRVLRSVTHNMLMAAGVEGEYIFSNGDVCTSVLFITQGALIYRSDRNRLQNTPRIKHRHSRSDPGHDYLVPGDVVSEATLWTTWEHTGDLVCDSEALLISLDANLFAKLITASSRATVLAVKYAKHFVWHMNRTRYTSDLMEFPLTLEEIARDLFIGGPEDHFAFISHYKVEAGTEATLMLNELQVMIRKDPQNHACDFRSPIFVDTEDLTDLARLVNHVQGSLALIVLLSPNLLSRPWCLLEMVTAKRHNRPFVPVLLTRPGMQYTFPDEEFYEKLHRDEIIQDGAGGRKLLEENGTTLEEVEQAIRAIFMTIALPFSPHRSGAVREAEMTDILHRCNQVVNNKIPTKS